MDSLPDPLDDRVMKDVLPPPQMPLSHSKLYPNKSKHYYFNIKTEFLIGKSYGIISREKED